MLGVRRRVFNDTEGKVKEVVVDMIPFVEGMAEAFQTFFCQMSRLRSQFQASSLSAKLTLSMTLRATLYLTLVFNRQWGWHFGQHDIAFLSVELVVV